MKFLFFLILLSLVFGYYAQVVQVTDANFDQLVKKPDQWVMEFYADWCGYCTHFAPVFDIVEENIRTTNYHHPIYFGKVNIDEKSCLGRAVFRLTFADFIPCSSTSSAYSSPDRRCVFDDRLTEHQEWKSISPIGGWRSPYSLFGYLLGWTGYSVKMLSTISPWLMIGLLFGLLVCGLALTSYFSPRPSSLPVNEEPTVSSAIAAGRSSSTAFNNKLPNTQKRQSRRID